MEDDLVLEPFNPNEKPRRIVSEDCLKLPGKKVTVIPLTWFEKCYQVMINIEKPFDEFLEPHDYNLIVEDKDEEMFLFKNGHIKKVLNPNITDPFAKHARQIKLGEKWVGLEFAMLGTRTKYGQFVLSISPLTEFLNLMMTKMQILPYITVKNRDIMS